MTASIFQAFRDNWQVMSRHGYDSQIFWDALDMSKDQIENVVSLLESIETHVGGYDIQERYESDAAVYYTTGQGGIFKDIMPIR